MKISEVIEKLAGILKENGDMVVCGYNNRSDIFEEIESVNLYVPTVYQGEDMEIHQASFVEIE